MVSLSRSFNTNLGGVTFFSESVNMDDRQQLLPILDSFEGFKKIQTLPLFTFHILFTLILDILAIVYAIIHPDESSRCKQYFIIIYLHIALWCFTFVLHVVTKYLHYRIWLKGYLEFHKSIELHSSLPFIVVSLWTVLLLFIQTLMQHFYPDNFSEKCLNGGSLSPRVYLCAFITLEFCTLLGINVSYMVKVFKFNRQQAPPDVLKNEWQTPANPDTFTQNEVGYQEMGGKVYDFLEKQAYLIRYLKEHNARLGEKLMTLTSQLRHRNHTDAETETISTST